MSLACHLGLVQQQFDKPIINKEDEMNMVPSFLTFNTDKYFPCPSNVVKTYTVVPNTLHSHKPPKFNLNAKLPQSNLPLIHTTHATL